MAQFHRFDVALSKILPNGEVRTDAACLGLSCAEDEGFEPSVGCPTHAFQACALGRYANPPVLLTRLKGIGGGD